MYKDMMFECISDLVCDFRKAYEMWGHTLLRIHVGLTVSHNPHSRKVVCWRCCSIETKTKPWEAICSTLDRFSTQIYKLEASYRISGVFPQFEKSR